MIRDQGGSNVIITIWADGVPYPRLNTAPTPSKIPVIMPGDDYSKGLASRDIVLSSLLEPILLCKEPLVITGDFNIHVDIPSESIQFSELLRSLSLIQHVISLLMRKVTFLI